MMKLAAIAALTLLALNLWAGAPGPKAESKEDWRPIFNGKDKTGWRMCGPGEFKVEKGALVTYGGMGMLWYSEEQFGDCEIKVVFTLTDPKDNSGVFIRFPNEPRNPMQAVHEGYEVQIDNNDDEYHRTGCIYSMTKARAMVSPEVGEEATMTIRLDGPRTTVHVNGELVTDYAEGDPVPEKKKIYEPNRGPRPNQGYIGLQNHGHDAHVHFKEISVRPLK